MLGIKRIALGAIAVAGICPAAFALDQTGVDNVVGTDHEFFISGATASDSAITAFVKNDLCQAGTYDLWEDFDGTTKGGNWFAHTCKLNNASPVPATLQNSDVVIHKRSKIGSIYGVYPIAKNSYIEFLNLKSGRGSGNCSLDPADVTNHTYLCTVGNVASGFRDTPRHAGNSDECDYQGAAPANPVAPAAANLDTLCRRGSMGTADVEAEMFQGINLTNITGDDFVKLSSGQLATAQFNRKRTIGQVFAVAVSGSVYGALQTAQGIGTGQPSLSGDQVRQLLSGSVGHWSDVIHGATFGSADNISVCRREQGSGSQATSNMYFFNNPCDGAAAAPATDTGGVRTAAGLYVKENTSSGKAKTCLNDADAGNLPGGVSGGIGVLSANGDPAVGETWKYVKVNGFAPTLENAIKGKYDFWTESQVGWKPQNETANETALMTVLRDELSKPTRITAVGAKGIAALSFNGFVWDDGTNNTAFPTIYTATNPVLGGKHGANGNFPAGGTSPVSCRLIQNSADAATAPNRTE